MLKKFFSIKWMFATIFVILGVLLMIRLGFWQLDRLAQRRALNAVVMAQLNAPVLSLDANTLSDPKLAGKLTGMQYRSVTIKGEFDPSQQVLLVNQAFNEQFGADLVTPLRIQGTNQAILVDRGWIPQANYASGDLAKYNQSGTVEIQGMILLSQTQPEVGRASDKIPATGRLNDWFTLNVPGIAKQTSYQLLPVYIQQAPPQQGLTAPPYANLPQLDLSEGPHMGYAIQWFIFSATLAFGFPYFAYTEIKKQMKKEMALEQPSQVNQL